MSILRLGNSGNRWAKKKKEKKSSREYGISWGRGFRAGKLIKKRIAANHVGVPCTSKREGNLWKGKCKESWG